MAAGEGFSFTDYQYRLFVDSEEFFVEYSDIGIAPIPVL
jgi:hypothetical protein